MSTTYSPSGVRVKVYPYEDFQGIDASRDISALDTGQKQHMVEIENGFSDWRGTIVREAGAATLPSARKERRVGLELSDTALESRWPERSTWA